MRVPRVLAFHAEKLHDDQVWGRVERVARWMAWKDIKATFFVYPFRAQVAGRDITGRVQTLASLGHEIGQHTHFYAGAKIEKPDKSNDLSDENIIRCLRRDFETLSAMGFSPKGFTAGAWLANETVWDMLVDLGFLYDCSARFPGPNKTPAIPYVHWRRAPHFYSNGRGRLLCLPTTCSLGEWFRWTRNVHVVVSSSYQLIYLHDYDLLSRRAYLLTWLLLLASRSMACDTYDLYACEVGVKDEPRKKLSKDRTTKAR